MARRRTTPPSPQRLILDAGAVIALARNDPRARAFIRRAIELDAEVRVPVVVLAETLRGTARDAGVHRVLNAVSDSLPIDEAIGRRAARCSGAPIVPTPWTRSSSPRRSNPAEQGYSPATRSI